MEKNLEKYLISNVRSLDEWKDIANKSLKDISIEDLYKDYDKDIQKKILYTENDYSKITNFSYSRGIKKDHDVNLPWHICSIIDPTNDAQLYNSRILNELERGASSIEVSYIPQENADIIFNGVDLSIAPIFLRNTEEPLKNASAFLNLLVNWEKKNKKEAIGGLEIDPIAIQAKKGGEFKEQDLYQDYVEFIKINKEKSLNLITYDGIIWNELGATLIEEISLIVSSFLDSIKKNLIDDQTSLNFTISLDTDFFLNIAKIRATRLVLKNIINHFNIKPKISISAKTSKEMIYKESPWVNQLRITNASLAAAIANVDRLTCYHITNPIGQAPEFVRRLTRNTHIILQEESNIGKIQDPSGGSYYIENITATLSEKSLLLIKEIEKNEGIFQFIKDTDLLKKINQNKKKNKINLENETLKRIGVNLFPDKEKREINVKPYENLE